MTTPELVRPATIADLDLIVEFNIALAHESEDTVLDPAIVRRGVDWALHHPDELPYYVVETGGRVVAQCAHSREWSDWQNGWLWWLQSVYVHPDHRGRKLFRRLFDHIADLAAARCDVCEIRLYVDTHNDSAQRVYEKLGMNPAGYLVYGIPVRAATPT
ncbi:MAG: GNAT family N-acetyltransferase [Phycisphaerales bacterium]|nr:GNAT family N-acetyltransferase [Phycisphaerales bacterium]